MYDCADIQMQRGICWESGTSFPRVPQVYPARVWKAETFRMARVKLALALVAAGAISVLMTACGSNSGTIISPPPKSYTLTVDSTGLVSGVSITASPADNSGDTSGATPFSLTYNSGTQVTLTAPLPPGYGFTSWTGCTTTSGSTCNVTLTANTTVTANYSATPPVTHTLTVDSTNPASGVSVTASPADNNSVSSGSTAFTLTYADSTAVTLTAPATSGSNTFASWTGCTTATAETCSVTLTANTTVTANYTSAVTQVTPTVTVSPASASITTEQSLSVTVTVNGGTGNPTPTGSVVLSSGSYTSSSTTLASGSIAITVPKGSLTPGLNTLTATYTPDSASSAAYTSATGTHLVTETKITPTIAIAVSPANLPANQSATVTVTVSAPSGDPTPSGSVVLSSGSYTSAATILASGSASISVPGSSLASGSNALTATYTPDGASSPIYSTATGNSGTITVESVSSVTVDQSSVGPSTTDQVLGMNLEAWYDVVGNASAINTAFSQAGIQAIRWPGGSWSDAYHWNNPSNYLSNGNLPYQCDTTAGAAGNNYQWAGYSTFAQFETSIAKAGGFDLALTADYGSNATCNGGGDPTEAAAWAAAAVSDGYPASHMTVGNENYGSWEYDLHTVQHDPTTYANAVMGTNGYYDLIKAASPTTKVGVVVDADCGSGSGCTPNWDSTILPLAKGFYDFVEFHYYPQYQTATSDTFLLYDAAPEFTTAINSIKSELTAAGESGIPIYAGEVGGNSGNPGPQGWSITQGLYAGQLLGEAMNDGVSRLTWWDSFANCEGVGTYSANLYGWQNWGSESVFSAGSVDASAGCTGDGPTGTMSPTVRAFQLFSQVAVSGENVLSAAVSGDTTDVRAYAATHSGGTALVLFNLNQAAAEPVQITLSSETSTSDLQVITYDKEIYDYTDVNCKTDPTCSYDPTHDYSTAVWAAPVTTDMGSQTLPLTITLQPWSMNVVIIK